MKRMIAIVSVLFFALAIAACSKSVPAPAPSTPPSSPGPSGPAMPPGPPPSATPAPGAMPGSAPDAKTEKKPAKPKDVSDDPFAQKSPSGPGTKSVARSVGSALLKGLVGSGHSKAKNPAEVKFTE